MMIVAVASTAAFAVATSRDSDELRPMSTGKPLPLRLYPLEGNRATACACVIWFVSDKRQVEITRKRERENGTRATNRRLAADVPTARTKRFRLGARCRQLRETAERRKRRVIVRVLDDRVVRWRRAGDGRRRKRHRNRSDRATKIERVLCLRCGERGFVDQVCRRNRSPVPIGQDNGT